MKRQEVIESSDTFIIHTSCRSIQRAKAVINDNTVTFDNSKIVVSDGDLVRLFSDSGFTSTYIIRVHTRAVSSKPQIRLYKIPDRIDRN